MSLNAPPPWSVLAIWQSASLLAGVMPVVAGGGQGEGRREDAQYTLARMYETRNLRGFVLTLKRDA